MEQRATTMERLTETELEVLDFMEELRRARLEPVRFSFAWGAKRRRSAIDMSPSPLSPKKKPKVSSPATTLAFPQSESEEKLSSKPLKIVTLTKLPKKIEELQKRCDSLSTEREGLLQAKEEMLSLKRKLEEENSFIKEKIRVEIEKEEKQQQQQLQLCSESEPPFTTLTLDFTLAHHQPLIADQAAIERLNASTRDELFDLNIAPAEESPSPAATPLQAVFVNLRSLEMSEMARRNRMMRKEKIQSKNNGRFRAVR